MSFTTIDDNTIKETVSVDKYYKKEFLLLEKETLEKQISDMNSRLTMVDSILEQFPK